MLYVTTSPIFTSTGSFLCLYIADVDVPSFNGVTSTTGSLETATPTPFTLVIYFLNDKSKNCKVILS